MEKVINSSRQGTIFEAVQEAATSYYKRLQYKARPFRILEIGTIRDTRDSAMWGDGWSTVIFAMMAHRMTVNDRKIYFDITSVDNNMDHVVKCKTLINQLNLDAHFVKVVCDDGLAYADRNEDEIDLVYMDGPYEEDAEFSHKFHLELAAILAPKTNLFLFDDIFSRENMGKGHLAIPFLLDNGFDEYFLRDRQALYGDRELTS